jgi:dTDP-4-amino-4,6-dideoxygalactose transaminase
MSDIIPSVSFRKQPMALLRNIERAFKRVNDSHNFILGEELSNFERAYSKFSGIRYCAGVGNGFDAILLSLKALGIGRGDEVIVPANTCIPTWMAVTAAGATIVPVEPNLQSYNIDVIKIEEAITSKTRAIIPVHLYGQACEMSAIMNTGKRHHINIIEDNAQAHGAEHKGKKTGSFGLINATSFYPTKNLGALGDGGAVTTNNRSLYRTIVELRNYGSIEKNLNEFPGLNSRLDEVQAAVLSEKLKYLDQLNLQRQKLAGYYHEALKNVGDLILPVTVPGSTHVYHLFVIRSDRRDQLSQYLKGKGIGTMIHYRVPPHRQKAYKNYGFKKGKFSITETISNTVLSLPLWPGMKTEQIQRIVGSIASFYKMRR